MQESFASLFGVTCSQLQKLISIAMEEGGEYADIFFEHTTANELSLRDNRINRAGSHIDYGVGIRVIKGKQTGYAYSETTAMPQMEKAARFAAKIASSGKTLSMPAALRKIEGNDFYPMKRDLESFGIEEKLPFLELLDRRIFELERRCTKVRATINDSLSKIMFFNSYGEFYTDTRPLVSVVGSATFEHDGRLESAGASKSFRAGAEILSGPLIEELARAIAAKGAFLFQARQPAGGEMPVVMAAGSSGILLHEAVGHAFEADFVRKGTSIFSDRLGMQICDKSITIVDDATLAANRGSLNYDDEGIPGQKTCLVEKGRLNSFMHDRISAKYYNTAPTGNGRRESFRYMPIPRMRATYMENGEFSREEIIAGVKKGIYATDFSNGQVQIGAGDFSFYVKSGYMIENGKLTAPVKDINIIGNGPQALGEISMVGNDRTIDNSTWTCGKGQYCPVSCGMPTVLVKRLVVGGLT